MDEIYVNVQPAKSFNPRPSTNETGLRSSERRFHGAVVLCLGLLSVFLLAGLIGLGVHHHVSVRGSAADLATIQANLTERLQASDKQLSSLTAERDLLNSSLAQVTKELNRLQNLVTIQANLTERLQASDNQLSSLTEERDLLNSSLAQVTKELNRLQNLVTIQANLTERLQACDKQLSSLTEERDLLKARIFEMPTGGKTCPVGWWMLGESCFFLSDDSGSWDKGRDDCKDRGADLVVVNSLEEQTSLVKLTKTNIWIGLNDKDKEGTWKWVDGTPLTLKFWGTHEPNDAGGKEDCAQITSGSSWNDLSCETSLRWICEKTA